MDYRPVMLIGGVALVVRLAIVFLLPDAEPGDLAGWEEAAARVVRNGVQAAYASLDPGSLYPPAFFYPLWLVGQLYRTCCSADFATDSPQLDVLMRLVPSIVDAVVAPLVFVLARSLEGSTPRRAMWAGLAYALNPAVLITVSQRGMIGDPYYVALIVLAVIAARYANNTLAAGLFTLAVLIKPQALALAPLMAVVILRTEPLRSGLRALGISALAGGLVLLPFVVGGSLADVGNAIVGMAGLHAATQNSADNLWMLLPVWRLSSATPGPFGEVPDTTAFVAGLSYRDFGVLAIIALNLVVLAQLARKFSWAGVTLAAAVLAVGFFFVSTRMHVNYVFMAFPFLCALVATGRFSAWLVLLGVTLACTLNWQHDLPWAVQRVNAGVYAASFALLCWSWIRMTRFGVAALGFESRFTPTESARPLLGGHERL
ncbi:MAG: hypothetical protein J2P17_08495 [Mycobacterium sp.]|nr:hypothetical protein [Mycobacterium sp.]